MKKLQSRIESAFIADSIEWGKEELESLFNEFKRELNLGKVRSAEKNGSQWIVNDWVKKGILIGFRLGRMEDMSLSDHFLYYDKHTYPLKSFSVSDKIRMVPGGSSIRDGCFVANNVTCMPPMYINVGAYVDSGTMIDSHALVGSCAQIGKRVHLSAAAQIGGVLEPVGAMPVIIEDDVLIGGNCGIYEGTIVKKGAVIGAGTILTGSTPVYDIINEKILRRSKETPLIIPENAVVIPGTRPVSKGIGKEWGLAIYCPVIIKYKDEKTDNAIQLEEVLR